MTPFDAFHLPGLEPDDIERWDVRDTGTAVWHVPRLKPGATRALCERLRAERERVLARVHTHDLLSAVDSAAARLADPTDELGRTARSLLPAITGLAPAMARLILERIAADWRRPALEGLLRAEFGDPAVLRGFVRDPARSVDVHAAGPRLALHVLSGNVPGVGVTSTIRNLLVRGAVLAKSAAREPVLAPLFARALADAEPDLGRTLAVTWWPGGEVSLEAEVLDIADCVVFYGGQTAATSLRERLPPGVRFLEHGPRVSFGIVARDALRDPATAAATAASVARATALFDQQGCVSPHLVWVEDGGHLTPREFAALAARALDDLRDRLPRGPLDTAEAAAIHEARATAEFRAIAGEDVEVFASQDTAATVIFSADPTFTGSPLHRVLHVRAIPDLAQVAGELRPFGAILQTAAVAAAGPRLDALSAALADSGVTRITDFERMPFPPPTWHHDGRGPLRELVRWIDRET